MIYTSDDYLEKYAHVFGYLIGRGLHEGYDIEYIERRISYSDFALEWERSNVTTIAFVPSESIYAALFDTVGEKTYVHDVYGINGWMGLIYLALLIKERISVEAAFLCLPMKEAIKKYPLCHEMDVHQAAEEFYAIRGKTNLDAAMKRRGMSAKSLSISSNVPFPTVRALRYGLRDIGKLEAAKLLSLALALRVRPESLLEKLPLSFYPDRK